MKIMNALLLALALAFQCQDESHAGFNQELPTLEEECLAVIMVQQQCGNVKLHFVRKGDQTKLPEIYADRTFYNFQPNDFIIVHNGENFQIEWLDNWTANRVIHTKNIILIDDDAFTKDKPDEEPWWGMNRVMTDLKQP